MKIDNFIDINTNDSRIITALVSIVDQPYFIECIKKIRLKHKLPSPSSVDIDQLKDIYKRHYSNTFNKPLHMIALERDLSILLNSWKVGEEYRTAFRRAVIMGEINEGDYSNARLVSKILFDQDGEVNNTVYSIELSINASLSDLEAPFAEYQSIIAKNIGNQRKNSAYDYEPLLSELEPSNPNKPTIQKIREYYKLRLSKKMPIDIAKEEFKKRKDEDVSLSEILTNVKLTITQYKKWLSNRPYFKCEV